MDDPRFCERLSYDDPRRKLHDERWFIKEHDYKSPRYKEFVNMYLTTQCYGGPEEGGWDYESGEFLRCYGYYSRKTAEEVKKLILAKLEHKPTYHMGHGPYDGADPEGFGDDRYLIPGGAWGNDDIIIRLEDHMGADYPKYRPFYEWNS